MSGRADRIKGVLLVQACGDALGSGYEFREPPARGEAIFLEGTFGHEPGQYTDDTEQACCVALARSEPLAVAERLLSWYRGGPGDVGGQTGAVLSRCTAPGGMLAASRAYARRQAAMPRPPGWHPGTGNGSLMRTGPVCLPFLGDRHRIAEVARQVSDLTHADEWSGDTCVLWSLAIARAVEFGEAFTAAMMAGGIALLPAGRRGFWEDVIAEALSKPPARFRVNGSAVGAFQAALSAVSHADSLEDGLQLAVAIGGDTDTVAAIAGALLGAWHGASAVPAAWRAAVWGWPGNMRASELEELALQAAGER